jgi:hypothetical protein
MVSEERSSVATAVTSSTARSKAAAFARDGRVVPVSFRTNCSDAARISSSVAGGSKFASVLIFRHIDVFLLGSGFDGRFP